MNVALCVILALAVQGTGTVTQGEAPAVAPKLTVADQLFAATNEERTKEGLPILTKNAELTDVAERLAKDMAGRNVLEHQDKEGRSLSERIDLCNYKNWTGIAENIASGQTSVDQVIHAWLKSPGHRRNMMSEEYTELGVAYVKANGKAYWVQDFGVRGR